ncbi:protein of unknown function (plasmid) [Rhodovastum atsumiense]|nr:protein of unknown function [Rhodovastum atsumiense]
MRPCGPAPAVRRALAPVRLRGLRAPSGAASGQAFAPAPWRPGGQEQDDADRRRGDCGIARAGGLPRRA